MSAYNTHINHSYNVLEIIRKQCKYVICSSSNSILCYCTYITAVMLIVEVM